MDPLTEAKADLCSDLDARQQIEFAGQTTTAVVAMNGGRLTGKMALGIFTDFGKLCEAVQPLNGKADIYIAQNIVNPEILGRAANRIKPFVTSTIGEDDIIRRPTLLVDCDPNRPKGVNSTNEELAAGKEVADNIADFLYEVWGVRPLVRMSGNGWHLDYPIDEPADSPLPAQVLKVLKAKFETAAVTVDASTADAPQLVRLAGTKNLKGDDVPGRPQRMSYIHTSPDERVIVTTEQLASLTPPAPSVATITQRRGDWTIERARKLFDDAGFNYTIQPKSNDRYDGGEALRLEQCVNVEHSPGHEYRAEAWVHDGVLSYNCPSAKCSGLNKFTARDVVEKLTGKREKAFLDPLPFSQFREKHKGFARRVIIDGLLRERDVMMAVGGTKTRKTFFAMQLTMSVVGGIPFLGKYPTSSQGRVLVLDYELFPDDIVKRVEQTQQALGVSDENVDKQIYTSMRGKEATAIDEVCDWLDSVDPGTYDLVVFDAIYRAYPEGFDENSNPHYTRLMKRLDASSIHQGNAFILVHHTSKGSQAKKNNTDIGSGAGAQSRAADCHLTLVEYGPDKVTMRASLRSFAPMEPVVLEFKYPIWSIDDGADPNLASGNALVGVDEIVSLLASEQPRKAFIRDASNMLKAKGYYAPMTDITRVVELAIEEGRIVQVEKSKGKKYVAPAEDVK